MITGLTVFEDLAHNLVYCSQTPSQSLLQTLPERCAYNTFTQELMAFGTIAQSNVSEIISIV